jgi:hypothetical protein
MNYKELPDITEKQKEIMDLVYRFRFVNRKQIQRLLNHKDPKRINTWLKDLVDKNYLGRIYSHKLLENTKPAIYYLHNNGILWVKRQLEEEYEILDFKCLKKFYQDKHASLTFTNHCVTLCEFYVQFKEYERERNINKKKDVIEYSFQTKTEMWIEKQLRLGDDEDFKEVKQYIPDLFLEAIKNPLAKNISSTCFFIELFDPRMPRYAIKYRIKQYIKYREEGKDWELYSGLDGKFPVVILIFPHQQKLNGLTKFINEELLRSYESANITFLLTTYQKAMTQTLLAGPSIWKEIKGE